MSTKMICASLTRIADFENWPFDAQPLDRDRWDTGDYVVGEVTKTSSSSMIELASGRMIEMPMQCILIMR